MYIMTEGFDPKQERSVDKDIIYKLEEVTNCKFIDRPLYYYRQHERGISQGENAFKARVYLYIAKCKAYRRRMNTDIPKVSLKFLYIEYLKITFQNIIKLMKFLYKSLGLSTLIERLRKSFPSISIIIENKIKKVLG